MAECENGLVAIMKTAAYVPENKKKGMYPDVRGSPHLASPWALKMRPTVPSRAWKSGNAFRFIGDVLRLPVSFASVTRS